MTGFKVVSFQHKILEGGSL